MLTSSSTYEDNSEEEWKEERLQSTFEMSEQTREELLYFVKYANAIYGLTLYVYEQLNNHGFLWCSTVLGKKRESVSLLQSYQSFKSKENTNEKINPTTMSVLIEDCGGELIKYYDDNTGYDWGSILDVSDS